MPSCGVPGSSPAAHAKRRAVPAVVIDDTVLDPGDNWSLCGLIPAALDLVRLWGVPTVLSGVDSAMLIAPVVPLSAMVRIKIKWSGIFVVIFFAYQALQETP